MDDPEGLDKATEEKTRGDHAKEINDSFMQDASAAGKFKPLSMKGPANSSMDKAMLRASHPSLVGG